MSLSLLVGKIVHHPESVIVTAGTTANFTCSVNSCMRTLVWMIGEFESGDTIKIPGNYVDNDTRSLVTCDSHSMVGTLGILASSSLVIQCVEMQWNSRSMKETYSKFALLIVDSQHGNVSLSVQHFISLLGNIKYFTHKEYTACACVVGFEVDYFKVF